MATATPPLSKGGGDAGSATSYTSGTRLAPATQQTSPRPAPAGVDSVVSALGHALKSTPPASPSASSSFKPSSVSSSSSASSSSFLEGYQPLYFSPEVFNRPDFDVAEFISDCRRRVPLENVLESLQEYSASLQNELVQLINRDYASFVSLSTTLVGLDEVIQNLRTPLSQMRHRIVLVQGGIDEYLTQLNQKLEEKQDVAAKKECLELFVNVYESIAKIETMLHIDGKEALEDLPEGSHRSVPSMDKSAKEQQICNILMNADEETSKLIQVIHRSASCLILSRYNSN